MTWANVKLDDLAIVSSGGGAPQDADAFSPEGIPFVRAGSLVKLLGGQPEKSLELLKPEVASSYKLKLFPSGTVLFAKSGMSATKGHVYQLKQPAYVVNHLAALTPHSKSDGDYLRHVLRFKSPTCLIKDEAYPSIRLGDISEMEVPAPKEKSERERIVAILDQADALRRLRSRAIDHLNTLGQAIFHEMFGDPYANTSGLPTACLGEVCDVRDGTHDSPKYLDEGYPLLTSKNFTSGDISLEGAKLISKADFDAINKRSKVDVGDIVMPMIGTIGHPVIVKEEPEFAIKNVALIKFSDQCVRAAYIHALLSGNFLERVVSQKNRGGTQKFISLGDIRGMEIPLPTCASQHEFERRVTELGKTKLKLLASLSFLDSLFVSLQQQAFRGEF